MSIRLPRLHALVVWSTILGTSFALAFDDEPVVPKTPKGVRLVYELKFPAGTEPAERSQLLEWTVGTVDRRINPTLFTSIFKRATVKPLGDDRIEVVVRSTDPDLLAEAKRMATMPGTLSFDIVANENDHADLAVRARKVEGKLVEDGRHLASWIPVAVDAEGKPKVQGDFGDVVTRRRRVGDDEVVEFLVVHEKEKDRVLGTHLDFAHAERERGEPVISLGFDEEGGERLRRLTKKHLPAPNGFRRRLAVVIDERIHAAPNLMAVIGGRAQITGSFTVKEVEEIVETLNAGSLPCPVSPKPVVEETVDLE